MHAMFIEFSGGSRTFSAKVLAAGEFDCEDASGSMCALVGSSAEGTADRLAVIGGVDSLAGSSAEGTAD